MASRARMCRSRKETGKKMIALCATLKDSLVNGFVVTIVILGFIPTALKQNLDCLPDIFYCSKCV